MKKALIFLVLATALSLGIQTYLHAGEVELTTYYPAPYGEYQELAANRLKVGAQAAGGGSNTTGIMTFVGQTGDPTESSVPKNSTIASGSIYYDTTGDGQFKYKDAHNTWKPLNASTAWVKLSTIVTSFGNWAGSLPTTLPTVLVCHTSSDYACPSGHLRWNTATFTYKSVQYQSSPAGVCKAAGYNHFTGVARVVSASEEVHSTIAAIYGRSSICGGNWCWAMPSESLESYAELLCGN